MHHCTSFLQLISFKRPETCKVVMMVNWLKGARIFYEKE